MLIYIAKRPKYSFIYLQGSNNLDSVDSVTKTFPTLPHRHLTGLEEFDQAAKSKKSSKTRHDERRAELFGRKATRSPSKSSRMMMSTAAAKEDLFSRSSSSDRSSSNASADSARNMSHSRTSSDAVNNDKDFMPFQSASTDHFSMSKSTGSSDKQPDKQVDKVANELDELDIC